MTKHLCKMCLYEQHSKHFIQQHKNSLPTKEGTCDSCNQNETIYNVDAA